MEVVIITLVIKLLITNLVVKEFLDVMARSACDFTVEEN
jgi:hypothetical protein